MEEDQEDTPCMEDTMVGRDAGTRSRQTMKSDVVVVGLLSPFEAARLDATSKQGRGLSLIHI